MNWEPLVPVGLAKRWKAATSRIDVLPQRERLTLFAGLLALLVAAEFVFVMPVVDKRNVIEAAVREQAEFDAATVAEAEQERVQQRTDLDAQLATVETQLERLGASSSGGQSLTELLTHVLARQDVEIVALREMTVEEITPPAADPVNAGTPTVGVDADPAKAGHTTLYRHRFVLSLAGNPKTLTAAVGALDSAARPLRIERVRMTGHKDNGVRASVTLSVIGTQRSWLSI